MGAGAIPGHQNPGPHSQDNSDYTVGNHQSSRERDRSKHTCKMSCETCSTNFTIFKRKKLCKECHRYFCSTCLPKPTGPSSIGRQCQKCLVLISGRFTREDLQNWKVKDIRCFLDVRQVSTKGCMEKHDLVELVLSQFCKSRRNSLMMQAEHDLFVQEMAISQARLNLEESSVEQPSTDNGMPSDAGDNDEIRTRPIPPPSPATHGELGTQSTDNSSQRNTSNLASGLSEELRRFLTAQMEELFNIDRSQINLQQSHPQPEESPTVVRFRLDDVRTIEEIDDLSIRQMKQLLINNFVDYRGCCEKAELVQRVKRLWLDHQENKVKADKIHKADELGTSHDVGKEQNSYPSAADTSISSGTVPQTTNFNKDTSSSHHPATSSTSSPTAIPVHNQSLKDTTPTVSPSKRVPLQETESDSLCRVCMDELTNCILLECGHMVTCTSCGKQLAECPICRQYISRVVRVFRS